jgi:hypothetical protein
MKAAITLTIAFDEDYLVAQASKRGISTDLVAREVIGDLECRAVDCCRWRDGISPAGVASHVQFPSPEPEQAAGSQQPPDAR